MLRLNVYRFAVPSARQGKNGRMRNQSVHGRIRFRVRALKGEKDGGAAGAGQSWDPGLEFEVPFEQRPVRPPSCNMQHRY